MLAPPTLDELNRLLISHALAAVASPRLRQPAREGKPDDLPVHNSFDDHAGRLPAPIEARKRGVTTGTLLQRSGSPRRPKWDYSYPRRYDYTVPPGARRLSECGGRRAGAGRRTHVGSAESGTRTLRGEPFAEGRNWVPVTRILIAVRLPSKATLFRGLRRCSTSAANRHAHGDLPRKQQSAQFARCGGGKRNGAVFRGAFPRIIISSSSTALA